jgi:hypothetical protein
MYNTCTHGKLFIIVRNIAGKSLTFHFIRFTAILAVLVFVQLTAAYPGTEKVAYKGDRPLSNATMTGVNELESAAPDAVCCCSIPGVRTQLINVDVDILVVFNS